MCARRCFFSYALGPHRALHSFPTRRSSDLTANQGELEMQLRGVEAPTLGLVEGDQGLFVPTQARSEEHTSELQSQSKLVCRLLLEKKNTNSDCDTSRHSPTALTSN